MTNGGWDPETPLDGALCAPTIIGHWKLVIGHLNQENFASFHQ
jgi:hypothetical protein